MIKKTHLYFHPAKFSRLLLIMVTGLVTATATFGQTATISATPALNETDLDAQSITITLAAETFVDLTLDPVNFTLNNAPGDPGDLAIESFTSVTTTSAVLNFAFTPGDFDATITTFSISIDQSELTVTSAGVLTSNTINISADIETATLAATPALNEASLDGQTVTIDLNNETFNTGSLVAGNFTPNNGPAGLTIVGIVGTPTSTHVELDLQFIPGDFDVNFPNFTVTINPSVLSQSSAALTTNTISITHAAESATLAATPALNEATLDVQTVTIDLNNETFNTGSLVAGNFTPNNGPPGLTIAGIVGTPTSTDVELDLQFIPGDFDVNYPNFTVTINPSVLSQSSAPLTTNTILISSLAESVNMNNPGLNEAALDDQSVTLTLTNETYDNPLEAVNFTLGGTAGVDYPSGLSIESVIRNSPTEALVNLAFNGTDFDSDFSGFYITIAAADLAQTSSGVLTPPERLDISSADESATLGAATALNEATLDGQTVTIDLNNETFNTGSLVPGNFTPNNGPAGLTIVGIVGTPTSTHVELDLQFIPGDFDVNYPNFSISIFPSVLSQSSVALTTNTITITHAAEFATLAAAPALNEATLDVQTVTIDLNNETFNTGSLVAGNFTPNNEPAGLTIVGIVGTPTLTHVELDLQFLPGDFDVNYPNFSVTIHPSVLSQSNAALSTSTILISSLIESVSMNNPGLNEAALDGQSVTLTLTNETYDDPLEAVNFTLGGTSGVDYPIGLSIESVIRSNASEAVVNFAFDGTDFDVNYTNFYITIAAADLAQTSTGVLSPPERLTITHASESATLAATPALNEAALNGQTITIDLNNETFNTGSLVAGNFTPNNGPAGLTIVGIVGTPTSTHVELDLQFIPGDFDVNYPNFTVTINPSVLSQSSAALTTNTITITHAAESATLAATPALNEAALNGQTITIDLNNETFNTGSLVAGNFTPNNGPAGLTIVGIVGTPTSDHVELNLQFIPGDFDVNYPNFTVTINPSVLSQSSAALTTNTITITHAAESATMTGPGLNETALDGQSVTITLTDETFDDPLEAGNFALGGTSGINYPAGLSIESVTRSSPTVAVVDLAFNGTDFDINYTDFYITVAAADLVQTSSGILTPGNRLTITALVENPQATMAQDSILEERSLDVRTLTITLNQETFINPGSMDAFNFTLNNAPGGLSIAGFVGTPTATQAVLDLAFVPGDFDIGYPGLSVTISQSVLIQSSTDLTTTNALPVIPNIESATLTPIEPLTETNLREGRLLTVTLVNEEFISPGTLNATNFYLINAPIGLDIISAYGTAPTLATVLVQYTGTDFDVDFPDFAVGMYPSGLRYTSDVDLVTAPPIVITALVEIPVATLVPGPTLSEYSLNGRFIGISLLEESFNNPAGLLPVNFTLVDAPPGLSINSVTGDATSAALELLFDFTDFDVDYPDFHIVIDNSVLTQSTADLVTDSVLIEYGLEPVIDTVFIPNVPMRIGSVVPVTIRVLDDEGNTFSLVDGGVIGGYPLAGLTRVNATTYTSSFTVIAGGLDYPASQDIHVIGIQLLNDTIPGNTYSGYISQDNDEIDGNPPVIQYIYTFMSGAQNVGSEIEIWIQTTEVGLTFTPTSHVNNVPLSSPSVDTSSIGFGRYRLSYTVAEGDADVDPGELIVSVVAIDEAGNQGPPTPIDANDLSIDASTPVITRAYILSTDENIGVGETIEIVVIADQPGYRNLNASTWINGVYVDPPHLTFTDRGDNTYLYSYTVQQEDGVVARGELAINIVLQDAAPFSNANLAFTALDPNNVQIVTTRPSAFISGSTEICNGESTLITVTLGGTAPWTMDISDGTSTTQHTSPGAIYTFPVSPEVSTVYTVTRVVDGTGNDNNGTGQAAITVTVLPDVQILNLQGRYDVLSSPVVLEFTPAGGSFTGPGISDSPWTFNPEAAGVSAANSPHEIVYTYTHAQSECIKSDTREVIVVSGSGVIDFEKEDACFNDATFRMTGSNVAGTIGSFSIQPTLPPDAFSDQGDNTAILSPDALSYQGADRVFIIEYTFEDLTGSDITIKDTLTIEYLEDALIDFIPDVNICQNEVPIALGGNYETGFTFTSPGGGVVRDSTGNYHFDPSLAPLDKNLVVYEHTSPSQCQVSTSVELIVYDAPNAGFTVAEPCVPLDGGLVQFNNRSDTGQSVVWRWDFGDPSSGQSNNRSSEENPTHHYDDTGSYTVSLKVNIGICEDRVEKTINIHPKPVADFSWNSNCRTDTPILMTGQETVYNPDTISNWSWKIDTAGTEIFSSDTSGRQLSYSFPSIGTYGIRYEVITGFGCSDTIRRTISLSPTYLLAMEPYFESFEDEGHGWQSVALNHSQNSWTYNEINPDEFPVDTASGPRAWYTDRPDEPTSENSWVLSPCFSFNDFYRPMVSLDIKRSLQRNRDGAALQYSIDNGITWNNVGDVDDGGLNWYNSTNITPNVGGQKTGWTGGLINEEDTQWYEAAHTLDELAGQPEVRFRVAFGSLADDRTETNDGFAFDNFNIRQRTRLSVLEYFTNANTSRCADTDSLIMKLMNEVQADVIDIQYHAMGIQADEFFNDNPVPANSRGTVYGVPGIPYAILDGGIEIEGLDHPLTYDFTGNKQTPSVKDIRLRSMTDPDFNLTIIVTQFSPTLEFSIEMKALRDLERKERTLYAIVLERKVNDPAYMGTNGLTVFRHVARKMLPDAGGTYLGSKGWSKDETEYANLTYEPTFFSTDTGKITIAVFMQDDETGEILQAATNPEYVVSTFDEPEPPSQVLIYPNPARELLNVYFEESPMEDLRFTLYDLSGKMVITDVIEPWQQHFTRTLGDVEQGMYILEIRSWDRRRVLYRDKLLHY